MLVSVFRNAVQLIYPFEIAEGIEVKLSILDHAFISCPVLLKEYRHYCGVRCGLPGCFVKCIEPQMKVVACQSFNASCSEHFLPLLFIGRPCDEMLIKPFIPVLAADVDTAREI